MEESHVFRTALAPAAEKPQTGHAHGRGGEAVDRPRVGASKPDGETDLWDQKAGPDAASDRFAAHPLDADAVDLDAKKKERGSAAQFVSEPVRPGVLHAGKE